MVRQRDVTETNERGRQLELCRLRQEKKRIQREDKYNGAALLFTLASKNEKNSQQRLIFIKNLDLVCAFLIMYGIFFQY